MFERYTEKARRTIFFARKAAAEGGSREIGPGHVLIGIIGEAKGLLEGLGLDPTILREQLITRVRASEPSQLPLNADMPLNVACKRVLAWAAEEAERIGVPTVTPAHLLAGILRENDPLTADLLSAAKIDDIRARMAEARASARELRQTLIDMASLMPEANLQKAVDLLRPLADRTIRFDSSNGGASASPSDPGGAPPGSPGR